MMSGDLAERQVRDPLLVITGFMGTGKTATGLALAEILGLPFVDTDALIEEQEGTTIARIFEVSGEERFRALEHDLCKSLAERSGLVVATGGGTLVPEKNFGILSQRATVVLLETSMDEILRRVGDDGDRPLLQPSSEEAVPEDLRSRVAHLLQERASSYHRIRFRVDTTDKSPVEVASRIASSLEIPSHAIHSKPTGEGRSQGTRIEIGRGLISALGPRFRSLGLDSRVFLLMPDNICDLFMDQIVASLDSEGIPWEDITARDGDAEKNLGQAAEIMDELAAFRAARDSVVVAVGGGVVGDLGGFVASVYMRGIPLVHVPTTLLAQVDSSIGGKVGVNHPRAKNLVGSFYPPRLVLSDPCALRTLPDGEVSNGMAEVVKTAILGSPDLFRFIEEQLAVDPESALRTPVFLERCVAECATVKSGICERDPFERDERRVLNLGHTLGHALESVGAYRGLTHGQAVSIGIVAAMRIAEGRGLVPSDLAGRTARVLKRCGLPVEPPPFKKDALLGSLHLDKKKRSDRLHFVLPVGIGGVTIVDDVTEPEIWKALGRGTT